MPTSSPLSARRGGGDVPISFGAPPPELSVALAKYCPFVRPSLGLSALQYIQSEALALWDAFRDLTFTLGTFRDFRQGLPPHARGLACAVVTFEQTDAMQLPALFSSLRPCVADMDITMGFLPANAAIRTGPALKASSGLPSLVIFRATHARDSKFRGSAEYQRAVASARTGPACFLANDDQWPRSDDSDGWRNALIRLTDALKGNS